MLNIGHSFPLLHYTTSGRLCYTVFESAILSIEEAPQYFYNATYTQCDMSTARKKIREGKEDYYWLFGDSEEEYIFSCGYISEHILGTPLPLVRKKVDMLLKKSWRKSSLLPHATALYNIHA